MTDNKENSEKLYKNELIFLDETDSLYFVSSGFLDIFAVQCNGNSFNGKLYPLGRIPEGQTLLTFKLDASELKESSPEKTCRIVAKPGKETILAQSALPEKDKWPELSNAAQEWTLNILKVCPALSDRRRSSIALLEHGEPRDLESETLVSTDELLWVEQGNACNFTADFLYGKEILPGTMLPLRPGLRLKTSSSGNCVPLDTGDLLAKFGGVPLKALLAEIYSILPDFFKGKDEEAGKKIRFLERQKKISLDYAVDKALSATSLEDDIDIKMDEKSVRDAFFFAAAKIVSLSYGIDLKNVGVNVERCDTCYDYLSALGSANGFNVRQISLRSGWSRKDGLSFVGVIKEKETACAVVSKYDHYSILDPDSGDTARIDASGEEKLCDFAFVFHPVLDPGISGLKDIWRLFTLNNCRDITMIALLSFLASLLALVSPVFTQILIEKGIVFSDVKLVLHLTLGLVISCVAILFFDLIRSLAIIRLSAKNSVFLQGAVMDRLYKLPVSFFQKYSAGDLAMRAMGIETIQEILTSSHLNSLLTGIFSFTSFLLMFYYSWQLAMLALVFSLFSFLVAGFFVFRQFKFIRKFLDVSGSASGIAFQMMNGLSKLKIMDKEPQALAKWGEEFSQYVKCSYKSRLLGRTDTVTFGGIQALAKLLLFGCVAWLLKGDIPLAYFVAFLAAYSQYSLQMRSFILSLEGVLPINGMYKRLKPILETPTEFEKSGKIPPRLRGAVEINNVSFRYIPETPLTVENVSLQIKPGEFVAFVGPSGAGKSTIFRLLLALEHPERGTIFYDNQDISGMNVRELRKAIGVVTQNATLTPGTIFENIAGSSAHTLEEAWQAAEKAGLKKDIESFPMGMNTYVVEGCGTLSGGQRQRLVIARALIKKPSILLLDEATSALDNQTQAIVSNSLDRMRITRVVIAHRLSTIQNADRIYVMDKGRIAESGSYDELVKNNGLFSRLVKRQKF